jgi:putative tricarboxylic transport membrane protein
MAPAAPGGGWDSTARALATALTSATGANVQVYNVAGAGGTVGLAQFANDYDGDPYQLMIGGMVMVGAILTNEAPVGLDQVTPIASLTTEWEAIAVAADSPFQTFDDLLAAFVADPTAISWGGGSAGGTDHMLVGLIAKEAGVPADQINYIAHSGGGEAIAAILSGAVSAGVSGVSEFADQVESGAMRYLAVSSDEPLDGVDAPTIASSGLDVVFANWRAIFAPGELSDADRSAIIDVMVATHDSDEWQQALEANGWIDFFQTGDEFAAFLESDSARIADVLRDIGLLE